MSRAAVVMSGSTHERINQLQLQVEAAAADLLNVIQVFFFLKQKIQFNVQTGETRDWQGYYILLVSRK